MKNLLPLIVAFTSLFAMLTDINAQTTSQVFTTSGSFVVPPCVSTIQVQCWGGGGAGGGSASGFTNNAGGGGGGGAYNMSSSFTVIPGNTYTVTVGTGGAPSSGGAGGNGGSSSFNGQVVAPGGSGGTAHGSIGAGNGDGGAGGTGGIYSGGNGTDGDHPDYGGGGGGGAGSAGNGGNAGSINNGTPGAPGPGSAPGGAGGQGGSNAGVDGFAPGGGGGGGATRNPLGTSQAGGKGGDGQVIITYTLVAPSITSVTGPGCPGSAVTINGTGFTGTTSVTINGTGLNNINVTSTVITGTLAPGTTTGIVTVTTPCGTTSSSTSFNVGGSATPVVLPAQSICAGGSYNFGGNTYTTAGTYSDTTSNASGCDSITTVTLSVNPAIQQSTAQTICPGGSYNFGGRTLTVAGTYYDTTGTAGGCDSITTLTLTVGAANTQTIAQTICPGGSYNFNGTNLSVAGTYRDTLASAGGCDSIVTLNLTVNTITPATLNDSICQGGSYTFNGTVITAAGTYTDTLTGAAANGCDSVVTLVLGIKSGASSGVTVSAAQPKFCAGDSVQVCGLAGFAGYQWNTGDTGRCIHIYVAGAYYLTATDVNGCTAESNRANVSTYPTTPISITVNGDTLISYSAVSYQWYMDNQPVNGATGSIYVAQQSGNYAVQITDTNGCHYTSSQVAVVVSGLNDLQHTSTISAYPNPLSNGNWHIAISDDLLNSNYEISDNNGRIITAARLTGLQNEIALNVRGGIYFMRVYSASTTYTLKLVKL